MANILTAEEVAAKLKLNIVTVRLYLKKGLIPGKKLGKQWRINEDDFDAFLCGFSAKEEPNSGPSNKENKSNV